MISRLHSEQIKELVYAVGEYIRSERIVFQSSSVQWKDVHDMVSYVDQTSEKKIVEGLEIIIPGCSFIGEETGKKSMDSSLKWIIDPLDGTTNFIHNIPHYCISIGLQQEDQIIGGWVYEICRDEFFYALKGEGAYMNKQKLQVTNTKESHQALIATGFPVRSYKSLNNYMNLLQWMIENTRGVRRLGTAAYDLCLVASGRADVYYEPGLSPWDVAAGSLIVQEAGGKVSDFSGGNDYIFGSEILASNGPLHSTILEQINKCLPH